MSFNNYLKISNQLNLFKIRLKDQPKLISLMQEIYPPVYRHMWQDEGDYYLKTVYGLENLASELSENALYCFIIYKEETCGILRVIDNERMPDIKNISASKLQRIYLSSQTRGKGIGSKLLGWLEQRARNLGNTILWLEVMDTQDAAITFYQKQGFQKASAFNMDYIRMHDRYKGMYRMYKNI